LPAQSHAPLLAQLDRILATIKQSAQSADGRAPAGAGEFVVVSSLAEGSDRLLAQAGLKAGYGLEVVLPFARAEYAKDFATPESRAAFDDFLGKAASVFELDGAASGRPRAYEAAGIVMLANIDVLITIWDGAEAAGVGGTGQIVDRAVADGIPVIRLDPRQPDIVQMVWSPPRELDVSDPFEMPERRFAAADETSMASVIKKILRLPDADNDLLKQYLAEKERRWNFCVWYPLLLWIFGGHPPSSANFHLPSIDETRERWSEYFSLVPKDRAQRPRMENILLPAFDAADRLAVFYSLVYRSAYVFNFLFAALAVALALSGIFIHESEVKVYFVGGELAIIALILISWYSGQARQWHRRWLEYRRLAESLRHIRILAPLGADGPIGRPDDGAGPQDWVKWYAWSVRRLIPVPDRAVDNAYLAAIRNAAQRAEIDEQADYHAKNATRMHRLATAIHHTGQILFVVTGAMCALFVGLYLSSALPDVANPHHDDILGLFTFFTALMPTIGAALGAIFAQGDFKTVAEQSERTANRLEILKKILEDEPLEFARLADRIQKMSDIMMADLEEWHSVFRTRPLSLPA
jgi:hypothetical protein